MKRTIASLLLVVLTTLAYSSVSFGSDPVTISIWMASQAPAVIEWMKEFQDEFNTTNPDIRISIEHYANTTSLNEKVIVSTASGVGPDLFYVASNALSRWIIPGVASPLDDYINAKSDKNDFIPDVMKLVQYKGKTYAFPFVSWPIFMLYNLELFGQSGVAEPQNWDEMLVAARRLTRTNGTEIETFGWRTVASNATLAYGDLQLALEQLGSTTIPEDGLVATLNTPEAVRAMNYLYDLRQAGMPGSSGGNQMRDVFSGKVAMQHWASTNVDFLNTYQTSTSQGLNFGMRRFVGPTAGTDAIVGFAGALVLSTASKNPDAAWRVIEEFTSPQNMLDHLIVREFHQTVRRSQVVHPRLQAIPYQRDLMQLMYPPITSSGSKHPYYTQFRAPVAALLVDALTGKQSITSTLQEADRLLTALVEAENVSNNYFLK